MCSESLMKTTVLLLRPTHWTRSRSIAVPLWKVKQRVKKVQLGLQRARIVRAFTCAGLAVGLLSPWDSLAGHVHEVPAQGRGATSLVCT